MNDQLPYPLFEGRSRTVSSDHHTASVVAHILERCLAPRSVLDLGCGDGTWLSVLADAGRREIVGVEQEVLAPRSLAIDPACVVNVSLAQMFDLHRRFDLVLCLEGPDHVEPEFAPILVGNCVRHGEVILFSAEPRNQTGSKPPDALSSQQWADLFRAHGFIEVDLIRPRIWYDTTIPSCYRDGLLAFVEDGSEKLAGLREEVCRVAAFFPLRLPHPELIWKASFASEQDFPLDKGMRGGSDWRGDRSEDAVPAQPAVIRRIHELAGDVASLREQTAGLSHERQIAVDHAQSLIAYIEILRNEAQSTAGEIGRLRDYVAVLLQERKIILESTIWKAAEPLRAMGRALPPPMRRWLRRLFRAGSAPGRLIAKSRQRARMTQPGSRPVPAAPLNATQLEVPSASEAERQRIVFISGEPDIPGHNYRVLRYGAAARALGIEATWMTVADAAAQPGELARASVVLIWRAVNSSDIATIVATVRASGAKLVYDLDDLMSKPELGTMEVIDGIRSQNLISGQTAAYFQKIKEVVVQADVCSCTTEELARHLRELDKITFVLPNCFDTNILDASRLAVRRRGVRENGILRIGYAAGTRTHQRDFRCAATAVARVLRERPECRLVLFRSDIDGRPQLDPREFPELVALKEQIEWRDVVPLADLPSELARFDINLAPLEVGNPFCEAKSELKYFEAALVEVCTIASPTGPMRRAMRDGETGRLAGSPEAWYHALRDLIDDAPLRKTLGHSAYLDVLARFGPERNAESLWSMLRQLAGGPDAARAFELALLRQRARVSQQLDIPASEVVFASDALGTAAVTVVIPLYNYARYVVEALDSVHNQTLSPIDLVVVDDASTDISLEVAIGWARRHINRFNRIVVMRNQANAGLARARNVGFDCAETSFVLPLDADNRLLQDCCEKLLDAVHRSRSAFSYSAQQCFGAANHVIGTEPFAAMRFASSNYIDAMALVAKSAWAMVGGYSHIDYGWEDYDFWCRCVEHGLWGHHIPEILAEYRFHESSMLRTKTDTIQNKPIVIQQLERRHAWLTIPYRIH